MMVSSFLLLATQARAEENDSGFLDDYSKLKPVPGTSVLMYTAPGTLEAYKNYKAVMIDQPEIIIAADSKYRGIKPDEAKAVADAMRLAMSKAISKTLPVVDLPGPGVLYMRIAASNVHLSRKKRGILGYTPAGFVITEATRATQHMQQKIVLQKMKLEIEIQDSQTQEILNAIVDKIVPGTKKPGESWSSEQDLIDYWARHLGCWFANSRKPANARTDCAKNSNLNEST